MKSNDFLIFNKQRIESMYIITYEKNYFFYTVIPIYTERGGTKPAWKK